MSTGIHTKGSPSSMWKRFKCLIYCWKGTMFSCSKDVSRQTLSLHGLSADVRQIPQAEVLLHLQLLSLQMLPFLGSITSVSPKFVCTACNLFTIILFPGGSGAQGAALIAPIWKQNHEYTNVYWCQVEGRLSPPEPHLKASQVPGGRKK